MHLSSRFFIISIELKLSAIEPIAFLPFLNRNIYYMHGYAKKKNARNAQGYCIFIALTGANARFYMFDKSIYRSRFNGLQNVKNICPLH